MKYNRVMLGTGSIYAAQCREEGFIGVDFAINQDLSDKLHEQKQDSISLLVPLYLSVHPEKSRVAAGLSCGYIWTVCQWLKVGDIVLCPDGEGTYMVGEIAGDYYYVAGDDVILPHRRDVKWYDKTIPRSSMTDELRHSTGSIGTCCDITKYGDDIQKLLNGNVVDVPSGNNTTPQKLCFAERSLHKILCSYVRECHGIYAKTIYHEKSSSTKDKAQKWIHPDIIGVEFAEVNDSTRSLMHEIHPDAAVTLYSFEMKRAIYTDSELKEYYFQALSNCSWANRGYLVAYYIDEDVDLRNEMARLNNVFGIGIIHLFPSNAETKILFEAKNKDLDFATIDKLSKLNSDFKSFVDKLSTYLRAPKDVADDVKLSFEKICDKVCSDQKEIEEYCKVNDIPILV